MKYGYRTNYFSLFIIFLVYSCSPQHRLLRLQSNHPYLFDDITNREVEVQTIEKIDTQFIWSKERDTIRFNDYRLERFRDTIRFFARERACTTYIHTTELRPSKTIEKYIEQKSKKGLQGSLLQIIVALSLIVLLIALLKK